MTEIAQYRGTGKRKTSVARVILRPGDGGTWVNGRTLEDYFPRATHRTLATSPFRTAGLEGTYDLRVRVHGGGLSGQADGDDPLRRQVVLVADDGDAGDELNVPHRRDWGVERLLSRAVCHAGGEVLRGEVCEAGPGDDDPAGGGVEAQSEPDVD